MTANQATEPHEFAATHLAAAQFGNRSPSRPSDKPDENPGHADLDSWFPAHPPHDPCDDSFSSSSLSLPHNEDGGLLDAEAGPGCFLEEFSSDAPQWPGETAEGATIAATGVATEAEAVYFGREALEQMLQAVAGLELEGFVAGAGVQDRQGQTYVLSRVEVSVQPQTGGLAVRLLVHDDHTLFAAQPEDLLLLPAPGHTQDPPVLDAPPKRPLELSEPQPEEPAEDTQAKRRSLPDQ